MARRFRRTFRKSSKRRKTRWTESVLGASGSFANTGVITGWLAFPAGQYDTSFVIPAFQPEDLTHVRSLFWRGLTTNNEPSVDRASSFNVSYGVLPFEAEDGNVYQNAFVATSGIGGVPSPAQLTNWDWLWRHTDHGCTHNFLGSITGPLVADSLNSFQSSSRAMRKLSHGMGLLMCIAWDWDDPALQNNGDLLTFTTGLNARSIFKEP